MKNRGVSEIISSIIVISVVVAGLGIYTSLSQQRILADTVTVKESINMKEDQISELIEFVDMFRNNTNPNMNGIIISPNNKTIPVDKTSELFLDFDEPITNGITGIVIKTDSNKIIQVVNDTQ